jgi:hypothetical protein
MAHHGPCRSLAKITGVRPRYNAKRGMSGSGITAQRLRALSRDENGGDRIHHYRDFSGTSSEPDVVRVRFRFQNSDRGNWRVKFKRL